MSPMSAEATVVRNYIDTLVNLPWSKRTKIKQDLAFAAQVLDEDHYGLDKVKDRILEYSRCSSASTSQSPSCAWSGLRASARHRSAERGARHRSQVRAHGVGGVRARPRSAAPYAPTSARCGKVLQSLSKIGTRNRVPARRDRQARH